MSLKYLAAYALCSLSTAKPSKEDVSTVVKASGTKVDAAELDYVFTQLNGKDVNTLIAEGQKKMTATGSSAGASAGASSAAAPADAKKGGGKKEEKKKEPEPEEEEDDFIGGLF